MNEHLPFLKDLSEYFSKWFNFFSNHTYTVKDEDLKSKVDLLSKQVNSMGTSIVNAIKDIETPKFPGEMSISNFPTFPDFPDIPAIPEFPKFPDFPTSITISNLNDIKFPDQKDFVFPTFPEIPKFPDFPKAFDISNFPDTFPVSGNVTVDNFSVVIQGLQTVVDSVDQARRDIVGAVGNQASGVLGVTGSNKLVYFQGTSSPTPVSAAAPLPVTIISGGSSGGGTQYTDGDATITHPIGTIPVFDNAGTITAVSATNKLPVTLITGFATSTKQSDGSQKTQIVDGSGNVISSTTNALDINIKSGNPTSITANAGTNLNTSLLALEAGGNLASIKSKTDNIPALGQALAAASVPVVLTAAQLTTLTPVTSVTVTQATGTNLHAVIDSGTITAVTSITNNVNTVEVVATTIYNGKKTVTTAGTRVTLASSQAVKSVTIKALSTNTGLIYVGDASVASTTGFQLSAGDTVSMDIANLSTVNLDSSVNGEGVTYIAVN